MKLYFTETPRAPHLFRIWEQLRDQPALPQVDRWLANIFRNEKRFGKKDRQWYADAVFAALRLGPLLIAADQSTAGRTDASAHAVPTSHPSDSWPALRAVPTDRLFFWLSVDRLEGDRFPDERSVIANLRQNARLGAGLPAYYEAALQNRVNLSQWTADELQQFLRLQNEKAPLWLRLNHPQKADKARQELSDQGITWTEDGESWRMESGKNLQNLQCIEQGILEIQDLASQMIGSACEGKGSKVIWDCCAGGGGKTMQLASRWREATIFASDVRNYKLDEVKRRAERAGLKNVRTRPWDGGTAPHWPEGVDVILIDAPCSGTGTWRRSPDSKYRFAAAEIENLQKLQTSIIDKVLAVLKPGGQLIYATCSWLPEENEDVVARALEKHPDLRLETQKLCGNPAADADTMFYASLRKRS